MTLLVTSRTALDLSEERIYPVPALELPDPSRLDSLARLRRTEAVRLFVDRARAAQPDFELTETNAGSVVELCWRLDGLPLALELAAARCNLLSPRALLERLDRRLDLLKAAPGSGLAERQRTLRAAIEWSYDLLGREDQQLFESLAVFVGGFTLGGAGAVVNRPELDVVESVDSLLRSNLVATAAAVEDEPRLRLLETIREYAVDRLAARGDGEAVRRRHAEFYLALAEAAEPGLLGPQQREWLDRLDAELDNVRAALMWALSAGEAEMGLRIASPLWRFWQLRSLDREGRERLEELLAIGSGSRAIRAHARLRIASMALVQGDVDTVRSSLEASLAVFRELGDDSWAAMSLGMLGTAAQRAGDSAEALSLGWEALDVARKVEPGGLAESYALAQLGVVLAENGQPEAEHVLEDAIGLARKLGNIRSVGSWQNSLAGLAVIRGDHVRARRLFEENLPSTEAWAMHGGSRSALRTSPSLL